MSVKIGTALTASATKVLFCGAGELGKEVVIAMQRLGVEVIAVDRYANAPGMQVAHRSYVINMLDGAELRRVIEAEKPDYIVPEVEAIATPTLVELEKEGFCVIPTANAALLTLTRIGIRTLAAEELGLPTSPYRFAATREEFDKAIAEVGIPCVVKPIMSSSGHGQSTIKSADQIDTAWKNAQEGGRAGAGEVIAVDRYANAPGMQVAHRSYVINMLDGAELRRVIEAEKPDYIVPEVEAIATPTLVELEKEGFCVIPTANAALLTMNRKGIRTLAAEELGLPTSPYRFAATREEFDKAIAEVGIPCVVKPIMSSSGHGQSTIKSADQIDAAWKNAQEGGRAGAGEVIVEGFVKFDYEITLLTVRHAGGTSFLEPIGHRQEDGDYQESWQPQPMSDKAKEEARRIAGAVTAALGGRGIFGVELFVCGDQVIFSEVSPRPHDTGMVTMISQDLSEFDLHARAILGLPIPNIAFHGPSASKAIVADGNSEKVSFEGVAEALAEADTQVRLFGKPVLKGHRRLGVCLARANSVEEAKEKVFRMRDKIIVHE